MSDFMGSKRPRFPVKRLPDGRAFVNLGSGARVAPGWNNVDFSWIMRFGRYPRLCAVFHRLGLLSDHRYQRILKLDRKEVRWNLAKGIPFADGVFDGVYHSHLLEHLDREVVPDFLKECHRVLKPGGILRVVVPDLEKLARSYVDIMNLLPDRANMSQYHFAVEQIFDQMVIRTPRWRKDQKLVVQMLEHLFTGNTARAGVLHRWMYDRFSLGELLQTTGFVDIQTCTETTSQITGWNEFQLDTNPDGSPYKPDSLYTEGRRF
jgi:SAM-dependent methyltransferase